MQTQRINITLPIKLLRDFKRIIPNRKRSRFIAKALEEKLVKKRNLKKDFIKSLKASRKFYEEVHNDWKAIEVEGWPD